jgi:predicted metal-binding protein
MDDVLMVARQKAEQLGFDTALEFDPRLLVPEDRIFQYCLQNVCGNYGRNYACPPYTGSIQDLTTWLSRYNRGMLLQLTTYTPVYRRSREVEKAKLALHERVLQVEEYFKESGIEEIWGMSGGSCALCQVCRARVSEPCLYPDKLRTTMEALGIDVLGLLRRLGLDPNFHRDKVTWTGCVLFRDGGIHHSQWS